MSHQKLSGYFDEIKKKVKKFIFFIQNSARWRVQVEDFDLLHRLNVNIAKLAYLLHTKVKHFTALISVYKN